MTKTPSDLPASYIINLTGIPKRTFYGRVIAKQVRYIEPWKDERLYSVKDWNAKNPDYKVPSKIDKS